MEFIDYYRTMGVEPDASRDEIKRAYRKLARQHHPDVSDAPGAEDRFKEVGEAWAVLKDADKRREYDALRVAGGRPGENFRPPPDWRGAGGARGGAAGSGPYGGPFDDGAGSGDFSDFFESIFGAGARRAGARTAEPGAGFSLRGEDAHVRMEVSIRDAFAGATLPVTLGVPGTDPNGPPTVERTLRVTLPKGATDGRRIRLRGQGMPGYGDAPAGDLYIELSIKPDPHYSLDGRDVIRTLALAPWEAMLGANVPVPTLAGTVNLRVPPGSSGGKRLRLKGRGLPGEPAGDQYVVLRIEVPDATTDAQRAACEALRDAWPDFDPRPSGGETS